MPEDICYLLWTTSEGYHGTQFRTLASATDEAEAHLKCYADVVGEEVIICKLIPVMHKKMIPIQFETTLLNEGK